MNLDGSDNSKGEESKVSQKSWEDDWKDTTALMLKDITSDPPQLVTAEHGATLRQLLKLAVMAQSPSSTVSAERQQEITNRLEKARFDLTVLEQLQLQERIAVQQILLRKMTQAKQRMGSDENCPADEKKLREMFDNQISNMERGWGTNSVKLVDSDVKWEGAGKDPIVLNEISAESLLQEMNEMENWLQEPAQQQLVDAFDKIDDETEELDHPFKELPTYREYKGLAREEESRSFREGMMASKKAREQRTRIAIGKAVNDMFPKIADLIRQKVETLKQQNAELLTDAGREEWKNAKVAEAYEKAERQIAEQQQSAASSESQQDKHIVAYSFLTQQCPPLDGWRERQDASIDAIRQGWEEALHTTLDNALHEFEAELDREIATLPRNDDLSDEQKAQLTDHLKDLSVDPTTFPMKGRHQWAIDNVKALIESSPVDDQQAHLSGYYQWLKENVRLTKTLPIDNQPPIEKQKIDDELPVDDELSIGRKANAIVSLKSQFADIKRLAGDLQKIVPGQSVIPVMATHKRLRSIDSQKLTPETDKRLATGSSGGLSSITENANPYGLSDADTAKLRKRAGDDLKNVDELKSDQKFVVPQGTVAFDVTEDKKRIFIEYLERGEKQTRIVPVDRLQKQMPMLAERVQKSGDKGVHLTPGIPLLTPQEIAVQLQKEGRDPFKGKGR